MDNLIKIYGVIFLGVLYTLARLLHHVIYNYRDVLNNGRFYVGMVIYTFVIGIFVVYMNFVLLKDLLI
jgi:hypothetical protein